MACKILIMWSLIESLLTSSLVGQGGLPWGFGAESRT